MNPSELLPHELMRMMAEFFESQGIPYRVVGSMASTVYGEPRFTNDVDIVAELTPEKVSVLCQAFPAPDFYMSEQAALDAVKHRFQFNILHPASGLKVDIIVPPNTEFARSEAGRVRRITSEDEYSAWFGSPEDVILNKLLFFQLGGSDKHLRDIAGMMKLLQDQLDRAYITEWAAKLGVTGEWQSMVARLQETDK